MTASPTLAARQIKTAQVERASRPRVAYSTRTGDSPRPALRSQSWAAWDDEEYCFVCSRCTDHVGEHDDLIETGVAEYRGFKVILLVR